MPLCDGSNLFPAPARGAKFGRDAVALVLRSHSLSCQNNQIGLLLGALPSASKPACSLVPSLEAVSTEAASEHAPVETVPAKATHKAQCGLARSQQLPAKHNSPLGLCRCDVTARQGDYHTLFPPHKTHRLQIHPDTRPHLRNTPIRRCAASEHLRLDLLALYSVWRPAGRAVQ